MTRLLQQYGTSFFRSDGNYKSYACLNIHWFLFKEAAILDIHEALWRHKALIKYAY